jgi:hypothetical protein
MPVDDGGGEERGMHVTVMGHVDLIITLVPAPIAPGSELVITYLHASRFTGAKYNDFSLSLDLLNRCTFNQP